MTVTVTRKYQFSASHRLHTAAFSEEENARVFGKCNNPYGHGHDYELEVAVRGRVDSETGLVIAGSAVDRLVRDKVLSRFAGKNINLDVPEFARLVPTTENLTVVIGRLLKEGWAGTGSESELARVHVQETPRNGFELDLDGREQ